jgi:hypothetical protein
VPSQSPGNPRDCSHFVPIAENRGTREPVDVEKPDYKTSPQAAREASVGREPNMVNWPHDVMRRRHKGRTGFTLIEIVIVVG